VNLLRISSGEKPGQWDSVLAHAKFAYKNSINRYVGKSMFQIVYGRSLKGVVYLVKFPNLEDIQAILLKTYNKCMKRLRERYNKVILDINKEHICEEDTRFLKENG
jgi:hypothetical protein